MTLYRAVLDRLADPAGTILVLEDLHWADDAPTEISGRACPGAAS
ncbi:hypothetical protein [Actinomycetospora termitidis]|uniref:Uncharacterized protein n=1 Tax=Actinomycetospora termitidis TaxID=3053470 RepID=A0ABT7M764_9PSEU|nr:hypothetical protein [Actinomycetospora sp. Odt1-22]MDL5156520.1 hypothetical protein [Actinomycetospora sp. Odt1-22]